MRSSIRTRLTIAFIGLAVGPLLLVGVILARRSFTTQEQQAFMLQHEVARRVATQVAVFFEKIEDQLSLISLGQGLQRLGRDKQQSILSELLLYQNVFDELLLLDSQGQELIHLARLSLNPTDLGVWAEEAEFVVPQTSGQVYYSPVRFDESTGEPSMTIAVPLFDAHTGLVDGTLISKVRLKKIWNLIARIRVSQDQSVYIIDVQDRVVVHRNPSVVLRGTTFEVPDQDGVYFGLSGTRVVLAVDKVCLGQQELNIVSEQSLSEALAMSTTMMRVIATVIFVAVVIAGGLGVLIVRQIVGPIQSMVLTAQTISAGDLSQQVEITGRDELGALATAFNTMTAQLVNMLTKEEERTHELHREIARRKKIEDALRESEERLELAMSAANEGIWDWNLDGDTAHFDDRYYTIAGYEPNEFSETFEEWEKRLHPDDIERGKAAVAQYLAGESETFDIEFRFLRKEGHYMWIRGQGKIVARDKEGNPMRFIGTHTDITERKHTEEALQKYRGRLEELVDERTAELREEINERKQAGFELQHAKAVAENAQRSAEAANTAKTVFLANMSHELRTPMNAILGFSQLLQRDPALTSSQKESLDTISRSGEHLLKLINDILEISRIEAGRMVVKNTSFDLWYVLKNIEEMIRVRAEEKGLEFTVALDDVVPRYITSDESKLRQVLVNLLGNAIKFTEEGRVSLRIANGESRDEGADSRTIRFEVEDTGIGISVDKIDDIFHAFERAHEGQQHTEGTGLGLTLSRRYVQLMGGDILVESDEEKGSIFSFALHIEAADSTEMSTFSPVRRVMGLAPNQPEYHILVVEDMPESRRVLTQFLRSTGFTVYEATNGQEAIEQYHKQRPHLIWMDMRMPVMDGYEATKCIRAADSQFHVPIIALTASAFEEHRDQILAAGCDAFVRKPFKSRQIFDMMAEHLKVRYVYEDELKAADSILDGDEGRQKTGSKEILTPTVLAELPPELLGNLKHAISKLDIEKIHDVIASIRIHNISLAEILIQRTERFKYRDIMTIIQEIEGRDSHG